MNIKLFALLISLSFSYSVFATDAAKEQRIAEQTIDTLFLGEPVWLKTDETDDSSQFLGLFNNEEQSQFSLLLLHGSGQGPNTTFLIGPLREAFTDKGYTTLSIQLPVISDNADYALYTSEFPLAISRINTAINFLKTRSNKPIVIVGHSMGGNMLMQWFQQANDESTSAIVAVGMSASLNSKNDFVSTKSNRIPVLDIYGQNDSANVLEKAQLRKAEVSASHPQSKQLEVAGADHFFADMESQLATIIEEWVTDILETPNFQTTD